MYKEQVGQMQTTKPGSNSEALALRLYVLGTGAKSRSALLNLFELAREHEDVWR